MRVLVCGSRTFDDLYPIKLVVEGHPTFSYGDPDGVTIIEGAAPGADTLAARSVDSYRSLFGDGLELEEYPANWTRHGRAAGPIRNMQMLKEGKPDVVWAFVDKPLEESRGTANMVEQAKAAGIPCYVVQRV